MTVDMTHERMTYLFGAQCNTDSKFVCHSVEARMRDAGCNHRVVRGVEARI